MKQDWSRIFETNLKNCKFQHCDFHEYGRDMGKQDRRFSNFWKFKVPIKSHKVELV